MSQDDRDYYRQRAEEELSNAQSASDEATIRFRYHLAALFLDRAPMAPPRLPEPEPQKGSQRPFSLKRI